MDGSGETLIGHWNGDFQLENVDRIIAEDEQTANSSTENAHPYRLHTPGQENPNVLGHQIFFLT